MERMRYVLGLLTLGAAITCGWFLLNLLSEEDGAESYRLRLEFRSARGLRTGADLRLRGVSVGTVRRVRVSEYGTKAVVEVSLQSWAERFACVNSKFWVVTPRFSGLTTGPTHRSTGHRA